MGSGNFCCWLSVCFDVVIKLQLFIVTSSQPCGRWVTYSQIISFVHSNDSFCSVKLNCRIIWKYNNLYHIETLTHVGGACFSFFRQATFNISGSFTTWPIKYTQNHNKPKVRTTTLKPLPFTFCLKVTKK